MLEKEIKSHATQKAKEIQNVGWPRKRSPLLS